MLINDIIVTFVVYVQRSDSSVAELARVVLEKKAVPDIIGIFSDVVLFFVLCRKDSWSTIWLTIYINLII